MPGSCGGGAGARRFFGLAGSTAAFILTLAVALFFFASFLRRLVSDRTAGPGESSHASLLTSALIAKGGAAGEAWADTVVTGHAIAKTAELGCAEVQHTCWAGVCSSVDYLSGAECAMSLTISGCWFNSVTLSEYNISKEELVGQISVSAIPGDGGSCLVSLDDTTAYTVDNPKPRDPQRTLEVAMNIWAAEWFVDEACALVAEVAWGDALTSLSGIVRAYLRTYGLDQVSLWGGRFDASSSEIAYNEQEEVVTFLFVVRKENIACFVGAFDPGVDVDTGFEGSVGAVSAMYSAAVWLLGAEEVAVALKLQSWCGEADYEASDIEVSVHGRCGLPWTVPMGFAAYAVMGAMVLWGVLRVIIVLCCMSGEARFLLESAAGPQSSIEVPPFFTVLAVPTGEWKEAHDGTLIKKDLGGGVEAYWRKLPRVWSISMFVRTGRLPTVMVDLNWEKQSRLEDSCRIRGTKLAVVGWGSTGRSVNVDPPPQCTREAAAEMAAGGWYGVFLVALALLSPFLIPATPIIPIINDAAVSVALLVGGWMLLAGGRTSEGNCCARVAASPGVQLVVTAVFGVVTDEIGAGVVFQVTSAVLWWAGCWAATVSSTEDMIMSIWLRASSASSGSWEHARFWLRPPLSRTGTAAGFGYGGARERGLSLSITLAATAGLEEGCVVVGQAEGGRGNERAAGATHVVTGYALAPGSRRARGRVGEQNSE